MEKCFICRNGSLVKASSTEIYCNNCRRVIVSAVLNFKFSAENANEGVTECKTSDSQVGWKGPGKKAVCHVYTPGDAEEEAAAKAKAMESAYAFQHRRSASKVVNSVAYFTGAPTSMLPPNAASMPTRGTGVETGSTAPENFGNKTMSQSPAPTTSQDFSSMGQSPIGQATAPGGMQPGELNGANPLNSGTTATKKLADLIQEEMGPGFCTEHMTYDGCNHNQNSH